MLEELRRDLMSKLGYRIAYGEATRLAERFPPADQQSDPLLDQHRHAVRAGHHVVIVGCRLADHVHDGVAALVGDEQPADPCRMRNQTPRSRPIVAGMLTGIGSRLRQ